MSKTYTLLTEDESYQVYERVAEKRVDREIALLLNISITAQFLEK